LSDQTSLAVNSARTLQLYKWMREVDVGIFSPSTPHPTSIGRFSDGTFPTLYLAETAEGAMAEFFRNNPSLLAQQAGLKIRLFAITVEVIGATRDLCDAATCSDLGIPPDRVTANEADRVARWADCQAVARRVRAGGAVGIIYPSTALPGGWNLVLFDHPSPTTWLATDHADPDPPTIDRARVVLVGSDQGQRSRRRVNEPDHARSSALCG
jgi:RES domain-containing protein